MKKILKLLTVAGLGLSINLSSVIAQTPIATETSVSLLSKIQREGGADGTFTISFGSLNGGLASLLNKDSSADGAAGFATWYGANSRTLLTWSGVTGSAVDPDDNAFYRNYSANPSAENYAGGPVNSIWSSTADNRALAFVTYEFGGSVGEIGLYAFDFAWENPAQADFPGNIFTLAANNVQAVYGLSDSNANGGNGSLTTSSVPEPSSASLMLLGAVSLVALRRLRKNV